MEKDEEEGRGSVEEIEDGGLKRKRRGFETELRHSCLSLFSQDAVSPWRGVVKRGCGRLPPTWPSKEICQSGKIRQRAKKISCCVTSPT